MGEGLPAGRATAGEAAAPHLTADGNAGLQGWSYGYALSDTVGYDFPEEDEKSTMQLVKEVTLWVVVAGFVAFFIIKVFLEGETNDSGSDNPGKPVPPPSTVTSPQPAASRP